MIGGQADRGAGHASAGAVSARYWGDVMMLGRLTVVFAMALSFGLAAPQPALGGPGGKTKSSEKNRKYARPRAKGASQYALFSADAETFRKIETQDMVEVARQMYALDEWSTAAVEAVVYDIQDARWNNGKGVEKLSKLLTARAAICGKLAKPGELESGVSEVYRRLLKDPEFSAIQKEIRGFERRHPHRFSDHTEEFEAVLDYDVVVKAHKDWHRRGKLVSQSIRSRGLLSGLMVGPGGKQAKGGEVKKRPSKPRVRPKARPKAKPPAQKERAAKPRPPAKAKPPAKKEPPRKKAAKPSKKVVKPKKARRPKPARQPQARPLNQWERYVHDFIQRHDLTMAQRHAACSILRDMTFRADQIERSTRPRLAEVQNISDKKVRRQRIAALKKPVDELFRQLQRRLDGLLTALQRSKVTPSRKR